MLRPTLVIALALAATPALAQYAPPSVTTPPAPTYGYQPYNPASPSGFSHPNEQGFGGYRNPTKLKGHRSRAMNYKRFRGY